MRKHALIFGGTSDIGVAIAKEFVLNNFDITLIGRNKENLKTNQSALRLIGQGEVKTVVQDFLDISDTKYDFETLISESELSVISYGEMNNQEYLEKSNDEILSCLNTNYFSQIQLINQINNIYRKIGNKSILAVSSVAGDRGKSSNFIYGSTKAGLSEYLSGLRQSNNNVHICTIKPGFVYTKMTKHLSLPPLLTSTPEKVGKKVFEAYKNKSDVVYISKAWKYIMFIIKCIPEFIFKRIKL